MLFAEDGLNALVTPVALLVGAGGVIAFLFRMIISEKDAKAKLIVEEKDRLIADLISERKTNKEIRDDAVKALLQQANWNRAQQRWPSCSGRVPSRSPSVRGIAAETGTPSRSRKSSRPSSKRKSPSPSM